MLVFKWMMIFGFSVFVSFCGKQNSYEMSTRDKWSKNPDHRWLYEQMNRFYDQLHIKNSERKVLDDCEILPLPPLSPFTRTNDYFSGRTSPKVAFNVMHKESKKKILIKMHEVDGVIKASFNPSTGVKTITWEGEIKIIDSPVFRSWHRIVADYDTRNERLLKLKMATKESLGVWTYTLECSAKGRVEE